MTISYVAQTEKPGDYVVTGADWNQLITNVNALGSRAWAQLTRGAGNLLNGTAWKDLFTAPASMVLNPTVSLDAVLMLTVNFELSVVDPGSSKYYRIWVGSDSGPDSGHLAYETVRHATITGTPLGLYHAATTMIAILVALPVNGANTIKVQYHGETTDAGSTPIRGASLVGFEI
jgi:hypothetical protein